ncbi:22702_t:CDS:2, partial [Dentiscutata erythropus]
QILEKDKRIARILRVKEIFETVIQKYEEAIYNYLGYKIEISDDNDVQLTL